MKRLWFWANWAAVLMCFLGMAGYAFVQAQASWTKAGVSTEWHEGLSSVATLFTLLGTFLLLFGGIGLWRVAKGQDPF